MLSFQERLEKLENLITTLEQKEDLSFKEQELLQNLYKQKEILEETIKHNMIGDEEESFVDRLKDELFEWAVEWVMEWLSEFVDLWEAAKAIAEWVFWATSKVVETIGDIIWWIFDNLDF